MKKIFLPLSLILLFLSMLLQPAETFQGASEGLLLWFQIVLPTLLPFLIITNLLVTTNTLYYISRFASPVLSPFFHTSQAGTFAVIAGFLCGYPMGAKVTSDLLLAGKIETKEARYLLSFCNNTSPMFLMNYVVLKSLGNSTWLFPVLTLQFLTPILVSFLFRKVYDVHSNKSIGTGKKPSLSFSFDLLDHTIMNSFEIITKVGGYIMLFSVLLSLLRELPITSIFWNSLFLPSLEITNGIAILTRSDLPFSVMFPLLMALLSFGGICSIAQTQCMLQKTGIPILPYIAEKLITATVTSLLTILYLQFICYP